MTGAGVTTDADQPDPPPQSRVAVYYALLILLTTAVVAVVTVAGHGKHGQASVAGGYDVSAGTACLGPKADLTQSGQFASISNTAGTLSGQLTVKKSRLTGSVRCVNHLSEPINASAAGGFLQGTIGGQPLAAELKRDEPAAGAECGALDAAAAQQHNQAGAGAQHQQ